MLLRTLEHLKIKSVTRIFNYFKKIRPNILCGGAGTRLWPQSKNNLPKQFIDFGGWTLFEKTLKRINTPIFDFPIITTNIKYVKLVKKYLKKNKVKTYKIVAEPYKKNTAAAILASSLIKDISYDQKIIFFPSDHIIDKDVKFYKSILLNQKHLDSRNIFIFGIKPNMPSSEFGYFLSNTKKNKLNFVKKFVEKPSNNLAKKIIKMDGYWNSGIFFSRKDSIINSYVNFQPKLFKYSYESVRKSNLNNNVYYLNKAYFKKIKEISFDYAILEKHKKIRANILIYLKAMVFF